MEVVNAYVLAYHEWSMQGHRVCLYKPMTGYPDVERDEPMLQIQDDTDQVAFKDNIQVLERVFQEKGSGALTAICNMQKTALKELENLDRKDVTTIFPEMRKPLPV